MWLQQFGGKPRGFTLGIQKRERFGVGFHVHADRPLRRGRRGARQYHRKPPEKAAEREAEARGRTDRKINRWCGGVNRAGDHGEKRFSRPDGLKESSRGTARTNGLMAGALAR